MNRKAPLADICQIENVSEGGPIYNFNNKTMKEIIHYRATKCLRAYVLKSWCWYRNREFLTPKLYPNNGCLRIEVGGLSSAYPC